MEILERINKLIKNPKKIVISTMFSVLITFLFAIYNLFLGIRYLDSFGISIAIYYSCLIVSRLSFLIVENKIRKNENVLKEEIRRKTYIYLSIFMFFIDFCLIAPITLMIVHPKDVSFGLIPSIAVAAYTTYKITIAIINYVKVKRYNNIMFKFVRELSVVDALVSILTLQHTLIMLNSGMTKEMMILSAVSSFIILLAIIVFSIINLTIIKKL